MPRSRRHVLNTPRMVYTTYRGLDGETVTIPYIVNSGKIWQGVKGHGGTTSRCLRAKAKKFYVTWKTMPKREIFQRVCMASYPGS